jgi:hypothetical protein
MGAARENQFSDRLWKRDIEALSKARRIYVATVRKDGNQSTAVPVWFTVTPDHLILIQTGPRTWIARRVQRNSPVLIWIGARDGPALLGHAEITTDASFTKRIVEYFPRKYLLARLGFHRPMQARFDAGEILAIKIALVDSLPQGFDSKPGTPAPNRRIPFSAVRRADC